MTYPLFYVPIFCVYQRVVISQLDLLGHCHAIFEGSGLLRSHVPQHPIRGIFGVPKVVRRVGVHGVLAWLEIMVFTFISPTTMAHLTSFKCGTRWKSYNNILCYILEHLFTANINAHNYGTMAYCGYISSRPAFLRLQVPQSAERPSVAVA